MKNILLAMIVAITIGAFASTASAGHPYYYGGRPSCGGGVYYGARRAYYRPSTNIRISYGTPGYGYGYYPYYRSSYYRPVPSYYGGYGYSPYRSGYSPYYGGRGGVSFSIGF